MNAAGVNPTVSVVESVGASVTGSMAGGVTIGNTARSDVTAVIVSGAVPALVRVTVIGVALSPTRVSGKATGVGVIDRCRCVPVPVSGTDSDGRIGSSDAITTLADLAPSV